MGVLLPQDPDAGRVERQDPHPPGDRTPEELPDPFRHLPGGLVREGDRQDLAGRHPAFADQIGDPVGQGAGLSGACPGDDQHRTLGSKDRLSLDVVEAVEEGDVHAHETMLARARDHTGQDVL